MTRIFARIMTLNVPTLTIVDGHCIAGGVMLAIAHDHVYVRDDPKLKIKMNEIENNLLFPEPMMDFTKAITLSASRRLLLGELFDPRSAL